MKTKLTIAATRLKAMIAVCMTLGLCACGSHTDQAARGNVWHPSGANEINLAAMVANPSDLLQGVGMPNADGQEAAAAVLRLRAGHVKPLPDSGLAELHLQPNGAAANSAAAGGEGN
jgi:type IV pilus biogenesis protein CpaD/CtpE